jgi:hypothetical protein
MASVPPEKDPASIGNILVNMGLLTEKELIEIVKDFRAAKDELLGEFIIRKTNEKDVENGEYKYTPISEEQIEFALFKQRAMRGKVNGSVLDQAMKIVDVRHRKVMHEADELQAALKVAAK